MIERSRFLRGLGQGEGVHRRDEDIVQVKIMAPGAAHADHRPRVFNSGRIGWDPHVAGLRRPDGGHPWTLAVHDDTGTVEPGGMVDPTGEVPVSPDTVAAVDRIRLPLRS